MPSAQDIVRSAYALRGAPYRKWQPGHSIPMWLDDDMGDPPSPRRLQQVGVMDADLINWALVVNGIPPGGGTGDFANYLVNTAPFDPAMPGQMGAIALRPYQEEPLDDGSIALYVSSHQVIQALISEGVTDRYTAEETYAWASQGYPRYGFTIYGFLPGVSY